MSPSKQQGIPRPQQEHQIAALVQHGLALHQQGQLAQAKLAYQQVLKQQSDHAEALYLLGVIAGQTRQPALAVELLEKAIAIKPEFVQAHINLAVALLTLQQAPQALAVCEKALVLQPDDADALLNRGLALQMLKRPEQALRSYDQALALMPDSVNACINRGSVLEDLKRWEEALSSYSRAIAIDPACADAYSNRGIALQKMHRTEDALLSFDQAIAIHPHHANAWCNRGIALRTLQRLEEALSSYDRAIALKPDYAGAYSNRGTVLLELNRWDEALSCFNQAIALDSQLADAYSNRGLALEKLQRLEESMSSLDHAIALDPRHAQAYSNRGITLHKLLRLEEALSSYDQAISLKPAFADACFNKSLALLLDGQFRPGWELYEWRWKRDRGLEQRTLVQPLWLGSESLAGKTILLHCEQGFGDSIQFCRYAKLVKQPGATVLLEVPAPLATLLAGLEGVDVLLQKGQPLPTFDWHCPLLSLPFALRTELHTIPNPGSYVAASANQRSQWNRILGKKTRPRVGLVWRGRPEHTNDHNRSLPLAELLPHLPDCMEYASLQKEVQKDDEAFLRDSGIRHFGAQLHDFADTAALCDLMDIVVSVDTSVAHLAAAMGKPTWILLPYVPDWRWLLERDDSPWYPSVRLYRQSQRGQWGPVLERVARDLLHLLPALPMPDVLHADAPSA